MSPCVIQTQKDAGQVFIPKLTVVTSELSDTDMKKYLAILGIWEDFCLGRLEKTPY